MRLFIGTTVALLALIQTVPARSQPNNRCQDLRKKAATLSDQVMKTDRMLMDLDQQIQELAQKKRELEKYRSGKMKSKAAMEQDLKRTGIKLEKACNRCAAIEKKVNILKAKLAPLSSKMQSVMQGIRKRTQEAGRLEKQVDRIETRYNRLRCDNLVAGQTAQSTIDECASLFSEWNRLQKQINTLQAGVDTLTSQYWKLMKQAKSKRIQLARLRDRMERNCASHPLVGELKALEKMHSDYDGLKMDLEQLGKKLKRFKRLKMRKAPLPKKKKKRKKQLKVR
ncbi:MAG: hypothetical protein ISR64_09305 [Deltaproteobacteria bacterium]|nr:hypothetical protein [Deltaproteobacteria bacterium]